MLIKTEPSSPPVNVASPLGDTGTASHTVHVYNWSTVAQA